jgi:hypothetical protein
LKLERAGRRCAWITHVQFCPANPDWILYNHEWPADCGIRRMWLWDGKRHLRLRTEAGGRSRKDWVCHEMWERDGSALIYHGKYEQGAPFVGRVLPDGSGTVEISLPLSWKRYGHFTAGNPGQLVTDGCYEEAGDAPGWGGAWISTLRVDWEERSILWSRLCPNGSSWDSQDAHPHPVFDPEGRSILFTSDQGGRRKIYRVPAS